MHLTMGLNAEKVELLLRSALLDDATNANERFGALLAEITVDDDGEAFIALDLDLWPEHKASPEAEAIADMLMLDIDWAATSGTSPFAWPGMGEHVDSTTKYFELVLKAYREQRSVGS